MRSRQRARQLQRVGSVRLGIDCHADRVERRPSFSPAASSLDNVLERPFRAGPLHAAHDGALGVDDDARDALVGDIKTQ